MIVNAFSYDLLIDNNYEIIFSNFLLRNNKFFLILHYLLDFISLIKILIHLFIIIIIMDYLMINLNIFQSIIIVKMNLKIHLLNHLIVRILDIRIMTNSSFCLFFFYIFYIYYYEIIEKLIYKLINLQIYFFSS